VSVALCAAFAGATGGGCAEPANEGAAPVVGDPVVPDPTGDWVVVGHVIPGISAMTEADASRWHGRVFHYEANRVLSGPDSCLLPEYRGTFARTDSLLGAQGREILRAIGLADTTRSIPVTSVVCDGAEWVAPGGLLIWAEPDRPITPWDGVFFRLRRERARS
jgi:hypothetical protein